MDMLALELSMEQQFEVQRLQYDLQNLDRDQVVSFLLETAQQLMIRDNLIRDLMKKAAI